ncbi:MAG: hypothetical protein QM599_01530 [Pseudoxanthomonas sp.]
MAGNRKKLKGRTAGKFALVPLAVLDSPAYKALNWAARALLLELAAQYHGHNNGDLCASYAVMKARGWQRSTLQRAVEELEAAGFIVKTRQGGRHVCNLYALTWQAIDPCSGKQLDAGFTVGGPALHLYRKTQTLARLSG